MAAESCCLFGSFFYSCGGFNTPTRGVKYKTVCNFSVAKIRPAALHAR